MLTEIKQALTTLLGKHYPMSDVYFESIPKPDAKLLANYFFITVTAVSMTTINSHLSDVDVMVRIVAREQSEKNAAYIKLADELDELLRPVFRFSDRAVTVNTLQVQIVDKLLHVTMPLKFRVARELIEDSELMIALNSALDIPK